MSLHRAVLGSGRTVGWKVIRSARLGPVARLVSHEIAAAPRWSPLRALVPVRSLLKGEVDAQRLCEIVDALDRAGIAHHLAGGWGVDALVGRQTRRHDDLDVIIDHFEDRADAACDALAAIGFTLTERHRQPVWMPDQWTLEDGRGARIDLLSVDWDLLRQSDPSLAQSGDVYAVGRVSGRSVACLSMRTQRLFHSGFPVRYIDRHDLPLLA